MVVRYWFVIMMCFISTYSAGMELEKIKRDNGKRIRSSDAAQVLANSSTLGQWKEHSFSSRALVEIIKKNGVAGWHPVVTEEESAMIKSLKKENAEKYSLLLEGIYTSLCESKNDTLQNFKSWAMRNEQDGHDDTQKELENRQEWIKYFDEKKESDNIFWRRFEIKAVIASLIVVEVVVGIVSVVVSIGCWN